MNRTFGLLLLVCVGALGCVDDGGADDSSSEPCVPGMSEPCVCDGGGQGAMVCEPDGLGYGACMCDDDSDTGFADDGETSDDDGTTGSTEDGTTEDGTTEDGTTDEGTTDEGTGDDGWDGESIPSWSNHIVPFFYQSCGAGVNGCHSREAFAANFDEDCRGWLSLEDEPLGAEIYAPPEMAGNPTGCPDMPLHDRLLQLAPWQCEPTSAYVDVDSVDDSYLLRKMRGVDLCETQNGITDPMPPPDSGLTITQMQIDMIEAWIAAGAPQD